MKYFVYIQIISILIIILLFIRILKFGRAIKYNERISKYTVNNNQNKSLSIGDKIVNIYTKLKNMIVNSLKKSSYFKKRSLKYEKYSYLNYLDIVATKLCVSIAFGFIYIISSIINFNFNIFGLIIFMYLGYFTYSIYLLINEKIRNKHIEDDLSKAIVIMNNAFKSGYTITQAVDMVSKDLTGPISEEFVKISSDIQYGLELKDVFDRFYKRVRIEDALVLTSSLSLLNITGGNLVGIFESIEKSFTNKKRLHDELNAMTSSSKLVFYILLAMPIIIIILLLILSPTYFNPLFTNPYGILICLISIILYISYIFIIRKILKVDAWK